MPTTPTIENRWAAGNVLASGAALMSMLVVIGGIWWMAAGIATAAQRIPALEAQQQANTRDIAVLKSAQQYSDARYSEILSELHAISDKLDQKADRK